MNKETIVSGTRPSGVLHVGNYLGAFKQWLELQSQPNNKCFFLIVDLHALTTPFEPKSLHNASLDFAASFLALGIDPNKSTLFLQSSVPEHANLAWIFNCLTALGELERMTEFKDKAEKNQSGINAGLLCYPTLMAADILLYKPTLVPVGEDQTQHLELTRSIARKFNNKFGKVFPEPKNFSLKPLRVKSLSDPAKKMSKTGDEALLLDDEPKEIMRKLKKAVTASEPGKKSPGVENLFLLLEHFSPSEQIAVFRDAQRNNTLKFSELKETLAKNISDYFAEFREKKKQLLARPEALAEILGDGAHKARAVASQTLLEAKQKIGLL
jgi:tryptophanyl-tRNA synthetase